MADLELTLSWLGMSQYLDRFIDAGFDSWETILEITENDLEILDVDLGHRRKLQREIANTKRLARDPAFVQPLYRIAPSPQLQRKVSPQDHEQETPAKRSYKHHPKPDPNAPERPYSAYVMFSNHTRDLLKAQNLSFTNLSKQVGERWQAMSSEQRADWKQRGAAPWEEYKAKVAEYQHTDEYQAYQNYVAEFKAAQAAKTPARRQSTTGHGATGPKTSAQSRPSMSTSPLQARFTTSSSGDPEPIRRVSKTATKRLKRDEESWAGGEQMRLPRARQACEPCRRRKIKCNGDQPTCRQCTENNVECHYENSKRESRRWETDQLWRKVKVYEALLVQFLPQVDDDDQQAIQKALLLLPQLESSKEASRPRAKSGPVSEAASYRGRGESEVSGVGSMGSTDHVNRQDFQQSPSLAFAGQASDTKWINRLQTELNRDPDENRSYTRSHASTARHDVQRSIADEMPQPSMEDMDLAVVGDQLYPFELPIKNTADQLISAYFTSIQLSFPLLRQPDFMAQYNEVYNTIDLSTYRDRMFLATLQLVFAIGAVHAHLINADWAGDSRDHVLYFAHARVLAVDSGILNDTCHLGQVQIFSLGGLYLLVTDQINRSWNLTGLSIRSAQSLGLHLHNVTPTLTMPARQHHARMWHAIVALEGVLTVMTGRPSMINERDCSVSLVRIPGVRERSPTTGTPSDRSQRTSTIDFSNQGSSRSATASSQGSIEHLPSSVASLYFLHYTELCALAKEAVGELYHPGIREKKWSDIQGIIGGFDQRLFCWKDALNPPFDVATPSNDPEIESCRVALRILFHSTRTIINRPCLCRTDKVIADQSRSSQRSNRKFANYCVDSARAVLNLVLNKPDSTILHRGAMWWMILHHLKRALTVVLLELSFRAAHMPADAGELLTEAKAAINWLRQIALSSNSAKRTWITMSRLLAQAAQKVGGDTSDIVTAPTDTSLDPMFSMDLGPSPQPQPFTTYDINDQAMFPPVGLYGGFPQSQGQGYDLGDFAATSEWDDFGFLRAQGGAGSFFPQEDHIGQAQNMGVEAPYQQGGEEPFGQNQWLDYRPRR